MFLHPEHLIVDGDSVWVPLETTALHLEFHEAWALGAEQWRKADPADRGLHPVHRAWETYPPVNRPDDSVEATPVQISVQHVATRYLVSLESFVRREIDARVRELEQRIASSHERARYVNRLGTLYARYGLYDDALEQFVSLDGPQPYLPALINAANIHLLRGRHPEAERYYERAAEVDPDNVAVLIGLHRVRSEQGEQQSAARALSRARELDEDETRLRLSAISGDGSRASAARSEELILWNEEDE